MNSDDVMAVCVCQSVDAYDDNKLPLTFRWYPTKEQKKRQELSRKIR